MVQAAQQPPPYDLSVAGGVNVPPNSIEAEQALLGGLMLDDNAWDRVAGRVFEADFYRPDHAKIFEAIERLADRNEPRDAVTLSEFLA